MKMAEVLLIALALAVDATVYAFSYGLILRRNRTRASLLLALSTGGFQALMPLLGYVGGLRIRESLSAWDHWIVLLVFALLGGSILRHAWQPEGGAQKRSPEPLGAGGLLLVGLATSIDALAVGGCMALGDIGGAHLTLAEIGLAAALIGLTTFCCTLTSFHATHMLHRLPTRWLETAAGLLLIGLGIQNALQDLLS